LNNYKTETQGLPLIAKHINSRTHTVKSGCRKPAKSRLNELIALQAQLGGLPHCDGAD
jgi:hypothetical protein